MNQQTEFAAKMIKKYGYAEARILAAKDRDRNSWGTFSHAWLNQVCKEIERLKEQE
jgi:hypothetical protein